MAQFILTYNGGKKPESEEQGARDKARWGQWLQELGDAVVEPGRPMGPAKVISQEGIQDFQDGEPMIGYTILEAEDLNRALEMAQNCPFVEQGTIRVSELFQM